jgi:hypothetical protein
MYSSKHINNVSRLSNIEQIIYWHMFRYDISTATDIRQQRSMG